jgi:hypothetical protein
MRPQHITYPPHPPVMKIFTHDGFSWLPIVNCKNGLICKLDILMMRHGPPGEVPTDIDNRVKTIFDALRKPSVGNTELRTKSQTLAPAKNEDPFYVLVEDDKLITHVSVTSDMLLEEVRKPNVPRDNAVRLVIGVTVKPYAPYSETVGYA